MKIIIEKEAIKELHQTDNHNVQTPVIIMIDTYTDDRMMMLLFTMIMNNDMRYNVCFNCNDTNNTT